MNELEKIALTKIKGIGPKISRTLLAYCGSVESIFSSSKKQLLSIPGIGNTIVNIIHSKSYLQEAEKELAFIEKHHISAIWIEDDAYPKKLKKCEDAPILLYYKGSVPLNQQRTVSIVGTRNATNYGKKICEDFIFQLKESNIHIVSGLAYGIDIHAHKQALKNSISTVAVLGHGLDQIYPSAHREIALRMLENGGLLTEFPSGTNPERAHFPMRNRIIAGLADVTVVIEAAQKGGALITAEIANSYNRDVCAFPGAIDQEYSAGCNYLIKTNRAHLIRHADDLCYLMNWDTTKSVKNTTQLNLLQSELSKDETKIYLYIKEKEHASIDDIVLFCDWPQSKLAVTLLEMEMKGILLSLPGKIYRLI
ncbi:DNA-processing protein DprA [Sphingobacterium rhinopitheci]|uniref:DNA-processing protein DprA n=1 Tax=Sphingobacterium rhinopitheci TaxID=2781960 RepID=UPI001F51E0B1|nr:DNA-processing protein DprA [Sphingobacterium rhinopitheci]MCI0922514.1 DNA-protecting protein DprA [Sphingobacterium rhinopitheci]